MNNHQRHNPGADILVVDDAPENLHFLAEILKKAGYNVRAASEGAWALTTARIAPPDLILLDIRMQKMSGYEVCKELKTDERTRNTPVVFISALNEVFDKVRAFSVGGADYITKPFQAEEVLARVKNHLALHELQKQIEARNHQLRQEVDERRRAEDALQKLNDELEQRIEARTAELRQVNASLKAEIAERIQAEKALQFELDINSALAQVSAELLSSAYDIQKISNLILEYAKRLTRSRYGYVGTIDPMTKEFVPHTHSGMSPGQCKIENKNIALPVGPDGRYGGLWGHSLNTRRPFYTNMPEKHPSALGVPDGHVPVERFLSVPVEIEGDLAGQIALANPDGSYRESALKAIERLGRFYALALQRQRYETDKAALQKQLQQTQKLEAIGALSGGIAHDFNNILFPIMGYAEIIMEYIPEDSPVTEYLDEILKGAKRAEELVRQILTFSRQTDEDLKPIKMQIIVKEALKLVRATLSANIEICQDIDAECGLVMASPSHIYQVAMNLITNAYHAMQESGGRMEISLRETGIAPGHVNHINIIPGKYVCLTVSDTGIGMDRTVMDRIFDPYFTTKEKGKGTGLGLAVVHGIVRNYGGQIQVDSEPGKGSVLSIYLPKILIGPDTRPSAPPAPLRKGSERILLVDDEEQIIKMERKMLELLGYEVTTRTGSIEALEAFRADPARFDLVITDLAMPNMTGVELSRKLLEIKPEIPIILCTGFSEQLTEETAKAMGIREYVMKPVVRSELGRVIRRVLDGDRKRKISRISGKIEGTAI